MQIKNLRFIFTFFVLVFLSGNAYSQGVERQGKTSANASQIYLEAGGSAFVYSLNYDARFGKFENGLGWRLGIGGATIEGDGYISIPAQVNYLVGSKGQYLEVGAGVSYISIPDFFDSRNSNVFGSLTLGFRKQPFGQQGLTWRVAFTPFIGNGGILPYAGASLGFRF